MMEMFIYESIAFENVFKIRFRCFGDEKRGSKKIYDASEGGVFSILGFHCDEMMALHSRRGVLRGMHYQIVSPQTKVIYVLQGRLFIAVVDLRKHEKTYGKWFGISVSESDSFGLYVPGDFAIGTLAEKDSSFLMLYSGQYIDGHEKGFRFDDADVGIVWTLPRNEMQVADKDKSLPLFRDREK